MSALIDNDSSMKIRLAPNFEDTYNDLVYSTADAINRVNLSNAVFTECALLIKMLRIAHDSNLGLPQPTIILIQSILEGMQKHVDGEDPGVNFTSEEMEVLTNYYLNLCHYFNAIRIDQEIN